MIGLGYKDMPRQTTADYLSGCTDPNERQFADGKDESSIPSSPETFAHAYKESEIYRRIVIEREAYNQAMVEDDRAQREFREAVAEDKRRGVRKSSPYTISFFSQVVALAKRQFQLKKQDTFSIYTVCANQRWV